MPEKIIYPRVAAEVKFYSRDRGYGFIKRPNKPDIFFTEQTLNKAGIPYVKEGDWVEFDLVPVTGKGGRAASIKKVEKK